MSTENLYCDCAQCGEILLAKGTAEPHTQDETLSTLAGRIRGRPYCAECLKVGTNGISGIRGGRSGSSEPSPWNENAVRAMEDGS